jgi:hypothetical protein
MDNVFGSLYEWWGLGPIYSIGLGDHLSGWDVTCTGYYGTNYYALCGWTLILLTALMYVIQYHIIDRSTFNKSRHWWLVALIGCAFSFVFAFALPYNSLQSGNVCPDLAVTMTDCVGFGITNAIWSLIFFVLLTSSPWPRHLAVNCRYTTFWR